MANDPLSSVSSRSTPQSQPIPGRTDQVPNSAGGHVWAVDDWTRLRRFLVLGSTGGTFYIGERQLTRENADVVFKLAETDGVRLVREIVEVSVGNLAPKVQPAIFALAVAASSKDAQTRAAALDALPKVCRTGYHLFKFATYVEQFRGWGRGLRRAVASWYLDRPLTAADAKEARESAENGEDVASPLALQVIKYKQREGWSHRDLLRVAHPKSSDPRVKATFDWICGHENVGPGLPDQVQAADELAATTSVSRAIELITAHNLPWETVPSEMLRDPKIWEALMPRMGYTALIRNVNRFASIGLTGGFSTFEKEIVERLSNHDALRKSRVHPFTVLLAMTTYAVGKGVKGSMTWSPSAPVTDALDAAFYGAFANVEPSGKNVMLAIDISGSMTWSTLMGTHIMPREAAAAMALITLATEPSTIVTTFSSGSRGNRLFTRRGIEQVTLSPRMRLDDVVRTVNGMYAGGTDCALPMIYAREETLPVDTFVVYTDSETWAGHMHPSQALQQFRQSSGRDARLVVVGMVSNGFTIADPQDPGMLDVVGFDASAPKLISDFSAGRL